VQVFKGDNNCRMQWDSVPGHHKISNLQPAENAVWLQLAPIPTTLTSALTRECAPESSRSDVVCFGKGTALGSAGLTHLPKQAEQASIDQEWQSVYLRSTRR